MAEDAARRLQAALAGRWHGDCIALFSPGQRQPDMDTEIENTEQIGHALAQLARLRHCRDPHAEDALDGLRPRWLGPDAWDILLDELETGRYRDAPTHSKCQVLQLPVRPDTPRGTGASVVALKF